MELHTHAIEPATQMIGQESGIALAAGEKFRVQKFVGGEIVDVLADVTCPQGKAWEVRVIVEITETDA